MSAPGGSAAESGSSQRGIGRSRSTPASTRPAPCETAASPIPRARSRSSRRRSPNSDRVFDFSGSPLGEFSLSDNDEPSPPTAEKSFTGLQTGTYVVREAQQSPLLRLAPSATLDANSDRVQRANRLSLSAAEVTISLVAPRGVTCIFQNKRGDEPPPEPPARRTRRTRRDPPVPPTPPPPSPSRRARTRGREDGARDRPRRTARRFSLTVTNVRRSRPRGCVWSTSRPPP